MKHSSAKKKLMACVATIVALSLCLCLTTYALAFSLLATESVLFRTGRVSINLNDGKPVIEANEFLFEPGATVKKNFFLENNSTWDVYYKLYFENVDGGLADHLQITLSNGKKVLYTGTAAELDENVPSVDDALTIGEKRVLTLTLQFPQNVGNDAQGQYMTFDLRADAVQAKNNPNRLFD